MRDEGFVEKKLQCSTTMLHCGIEIQMNSSQYSARI